MKKLLTAILTIVTVFVMNSQASAQVGTFNSLSLHFSNTILTSAQYYKVLEGAKTDKQVAEDNAASTKQQLVSLPSTGYMFGDNTLSETQDILANPTTETVPMATALENWMSKELVLQQPKRRSKN